MANASAKRVAAQNDRTVRNLHLGMFFTLSLSILFRLILRSNTLPPSKGLLAVLLVTGIPSGVLYRHLVRTGTSKRDAAGVLISSGEDLAAKGITELCFDVIYLTWTCHIGSALFGEWVWWIYLLIPIYAFYKAWTSFIQPMFFGRSTADAATEEENVPEGESKRQQKLRQRQEKGDPRVRAVPRR